MVQNDVFTDAESPAVSGHDAEFGAADSQSPAPAPDPTMDEAAEQNRGGSGPSETAPDGLGLIRVRSAVYGRMGAWEQHPAHPGGEAWVNGQDEAEVAATPYIVSRIRDGQLIQTGGDNNIAAQLADAQRAGDALVAMRVEAATAAHERERLHEQSRDLHMAANFAATEAAAGRSPEDSAARAASARAESEEKRRQAAER